MFRSTNLVCKHAVSQAISWFFSEIEEGIILEDDCIPHRSFFPFVAELLRRYRNDELVLMISGDNFQFGRRRTNYSYYVSLYTHIWGWATWRRSWALYDHSMALWPEVRDGNWLFDILRNQSAVRYWRQIFDDTYRERNSSWAYRWTFSAWLKTSLTVVPNNNLVSNIDFGHSAIHTANRLRKLAGMPTTEMQFPLHHPPYMIADTAADTFTQRTMFTSAPLW